MIQINFLEKVFFGDDGFQNMFVCQQTLSMLQLQQEVGDELSICVLNLLL